MSFLRPTTGSSPYPGLPGGRPVYAIGDLHGRADLLDRIHTAIDADCSAADRVEIYLGDYVDRGPDSRGTLDRLIARSRQTDIVTLRGNHEEIFLKVLHARERFERWRQVGGFEAMLSYGIDVGSFIRGATIDSVGLLRSLRETVPAEHIAFLMATKPFEVMAPYLFVHAGLRPGRALANQSPRDLYWIRDEFLGSNTDFGYVVVHGHTPVRDVDYRPNRINIDTGAYLSGRLTCLKIDANGPCELRVT